MCYLCSHGHHPRSFPPSTFHSLLSLPEREKWRPTGEIRVRNRDERKESVLTAGVTNKKGKIDSIMKNCSQLKKCKHAAGLCSNKPWEILDVCTLVGLLQRAYLVCDSCEDHSMGHERISIYQSLCLWKVLHWNSKHKLMVEPTHTDIHTK